MSVCVYRDSTLTALMNGKPLPSVLSGPCTIRYAPSCSGPVCCERPAAPLKRDGSRHQTGGLYYAPCALA